MIESVLSVRNFSIKAKIAIKSIIAVGIIALAVTLPQLVHHVAGSEGGVKWLPMYLPILLGGCLLGMHWGLFIGLASPLASFLITSAFSNPMPALARLPFMMVELAVFAVVSGAFSKKIASNGWMAFPAVLLAQVSGRSIFMLLVIIFQALTPFTPAVIWSQIQTGLLGMFMQAVILPFIVMGLNALIRKDEKQ